MTGRRARRAVLLAEPADRLELPEELDRWAGPGQPVRARHRTGRVLRDLAVLLADGVDCLRRVMWVDLT